MHRETLTNGAIRLRAGEASFLFVRLHPGVFLVVGEGRDDGQFGNAPMDELSAELVRFPLPLQLFIDARGLKHASLSAQERWTTWLQDRRDALQQVHMLSETRYVHLAVSIAAHHSRARLEVHDDAGAFELALSQAAPGWRDALRDLEPATITRVHQGGAVTLDDGHCTFVLRPLAPGALLLSIRGMDRATMSSAVFDEIGDIARAGAPRGSRSSQGSQGSRGSQGIMGIRGSQGSQGSRGAMDLFIDLRDASMPSQAVSELWASWFAANRKALSSVVLLSTNRPVSVTARFAQWRSRTGGLIRIVDQPDELEQAIRRRVPGLPANPIVL